jgi:hypothetical protein
LVRRLDDDL